MYSFNQYLLAKHQNSILVRFEQMCNALQQMLDMPVMIAGLHTGYKNAVSGVERELKNITPRCVLAYSGLDMDRNACTSIQASVAMQSVNDKGIFGENVVQYRRLPLNARFNLAIVMDEPALAIRMTEYLAMLSFVFPVIVGDEHTKSTVIVQETSNIDVDRDKNNVNINGSLVLNMQVLEPMTLSFEDAQYPLAGVGVPMPDGTFNETLQGEPILDSDGNPIIGEDGKLLIGNYVEDGWYRLRVNVELHDHARWQDCLESTGDPAKWTRPAGAESK